MKAFLHLGVAAAALIALNTAVHAESGSTIRYCTGPAGGNYEFTGIAIKQQLGEQVKLIPSKGSVDTLDKLSSGDCDAGIVQADAMNSYGSAHPEAPLSIERARDMYPELAHLICGPSVTQLSDLKAGKTILVGPAGSGSSVTWDSFVRANPAAYKDVGTLPIGGARGLSKVTEGTDAQCELFVAGVGATSMKEADEVGRTSNGQLHIVYMSDSKLFDLKDSKGRPVYSKAEIPGGAYPDLQPRGMFGGSKGVTTVSVESILVGRVPYIEENPNNYDAFIRAVTKAMPAINNRMQGTK